jgi:hypothetical protein
VGAELFHSGKTGKIERRADNEASSRFSHLANVPKNEAISLTRVFECFETFRDEREDLEVDTRTAFIYSRSENTYNKLCIGDERSSNDLKLMEN